MSVQSAQILVPAQGRGWHGDGNTWEVKKVHFWS